MPTGTTLTDDSEQESPSTWEVYLACTCLAKVPPETVTFEDVNIKTGSVNCTTTGTTWLFVFALEVVLSCTCGLSISDKVCMMM